MNNLNNFKNQVFYHSSTQMHELSNESVNLIITSPPYFNIKDYSLTKGNKTQDFGAFADYDEFINALLAVWKECFRVLKANGKLCINAPLMPMPKKALKTHYNRHIYDLNADIQHSILSQTPFFLYDTYIWNRTYHGRTKDLMFGSYPYPRNFYNQNTSEFITIYIKDGKPCAVSADIKEQSKLTQAEWLEFTKHIWDITPPNKSDEGHNLHPAIMPSEIPYRLIKMFSFVGDLVLDCFAGSGTTLKVARELKRDFVGYELYEHYKGVIENKISYTPSLFEYQRTQNA